jgi:hypothetical protein
MPDGDDLKYSNISKYFHAKLNKKPDLMHQCMVFNKTHLRIFGRKVIFRYFQLVRKSYQKLDFHGISRFLLFLSSIISMF